MSSTSALTIDQLPNEIFCKIFTFVDRNVISQIRLVCKHWRAIVDHNLSHVFELHFQERGPGVAEFLTMAEENSFFANITKFRFGTSMEVGLSALYPVGLSALYPVGLSAHNLEAYRTFFTKYGPTMKCLTLSRTLGSSVLQFVFSKEATAHLDCLETLVVCANLSKLQQKNTRLKFPRNLQHLKLVAEKSVPESTLLIFLKAFTEDGHNLKTLTLENEDDKRGVSHDEKIAAKNSFVNIFKSLDLEALKIMSTAFPMKDADLSALTVEGANLQDLIIHIKTKVSCQSFFNFLSSHRHSLKRLQCVNLRAQLLQNFPEMELLESFVFSAPGRERYQRIVPRLDVVERMPNLRKLECWWFFPRRVYPYEIYHPNLKVLCLHLYPVGHELVHAFLGNVANWFPSLERLEVYHSDAFTLAPKTILDLQQQSNCGRSLWTK